MGNFSWWIAFYFQESANIPLEYITILEVDNESKTKAHIPVFCGQKIAFILNT